MGASLNDYCARKLAAPIGSLAGWQGATEAVLRAASLVGDALVGVVGFGSWARAEMSEASDVDLLVVVDDGVALTRDLYRRWDEAPLSWDGHPVEPHFVHLPRVGGRVAGLWGEVAVEGVVLFTRSLELPLSLARVRQDISAGRIVRRVAHGQPYWVEAA
jgi:hypothetical protein